MHLSSNLSGGKGERHRRRVSALGFGGAERGLTARRLYDPVRGGGGGQEICKLMKVRKGSSVLNQNVMLLYSTRDHDIVTIILLESDFFSQGVVGYVFDRRYYFFARSTQ